MGLAVLLAGCTTVEYLPPSQETREELGNVAILSRPIDPSTDVEEPLASGTGALVGAGIGAGVGAAFGLSVAAEGCRDNNVFVCGPSVIAGAIIAVSGMLIGGVVGATSAPPSDDVDAATISLVDALEDARPNQSLQDQLAEEALGTGLCHVRPAKTSSFSTTGYDPLEAEGFSSVLEIQVRSLEVNVAGGFDPVISPKLIAEARMVRAADGTELYRRVWLYWGVERDYFWMARDNAQQFRTDLESGYRDLAERIVRDLFLSNSKELETDPEPGRIVTIEAPTEYPEKKSLPAPSLEPATLLACPEVTVATTPPPETTALSPSPGIAIWNGKWFAKEGAWSLYLEVENGAFTGRTLRRGRPFAVTGTISSAYMVAGLVEDDRGASAGSLSGMFPNISLYQDGRVQASFELEKRE